MAITLTDTNDTWVGTADGETVYGMGGDDYLYGRAGNDFLWGNSGSDFLVGGLGNDTMYGGADSDVYYIDSAGDTVIEFAGNGDYDQVKSTVTYTLSANVEYLSLIGNAAINGTGNAIGNYITGNSGNNTLSGLAGADDLYGEEGTDILYGGNDNDYLFGGEGNDTLYGCSGNDDLHGDGWYDGEYSGNDILYGGEGSDYLDGGLGTNSLYGGMGNDSYLVHSVQDTVIEYANAGDYDWVESDISYSLGSHVENLDLQGNGAIDGTGNALGNEISGNYGNNILNGGAGEDTLEGKRGNDTLYGGSQDDTLVGGMGNDILDGGSGDDYMSGDAGNDTYIVDSNYDFVHETTWIENIEADWIRVDAGGTDTVRSSVTFTLGDYIENLSLEGSAAINGIGNTSANVLTGNAGNNAIYGLVGNDSLLGDLGNDGLVGGDGNDILNGGAGNDTLYGSFGNDTLTGGDGADIFHFGNNLNSATNTDCITDFSSADDTIRLGKTIFTKLGVGALAPSQFRASSAAADANDFILYNTTTGALLYDADGNGAGASIQFATLSPTSAITAADFMVVA